jgi:hypothetical protein
MYEHPIRIITRALARQLLDSHRAHLPLVDVVECTIDHDAAGTAYAYESDTCRYVCEVPESFGGINRF